MSMATDIAREIDAEELERRQARTEKFLDHVRAVTRFIEDHPDLDLPYELWQYSDHDGTNWDRRARWYCVNAEEARAVIRALGGGTKIEGATGPRVFGESHGFKWSLMRTDLSCEMVETDEVEEVEETEVVRAAETRTVTVQRPKLRKVCPPILADTEVGA